MYNNKIKKLYSLLFMFIAVSIILIVPTYASDGSGGAGSAILNFLSNQTVLVTIIGLVAAAIFRSGVKIFREGIYFKAELVTKKEQHEFEDQVRQDMRSYRVELQKTILDTCLREIKSELKDLDRFREEFQEIREFKVKQEVFLEEFEDIKHDFKVMANEFGQIKERLNRIQFKQTDNNEVRRHE